MDKKAIIKQRLLKEIEKLKQEDISISDADNRLFYFFVNLADEDIQKAYNDLLSTMIPF